MIGSKYLVFVDESGDAETQNYTQTFPMFVLAFVIISKQEYCSNLLPKFSQLKLKYFPDANTIFHEREIRKHENQFAFLTNASTRNAFMSDLSDLMQSIDYKVVAVAVHKNGHDYKSNLYDLAVHMGLKRISNLLESENDLNYTTITFESRGSKEDLSLLEYFNANSDETFGIDIHRKSAGGLGLQFADLIARPIGIHVLRPEQSNRAWDIIKNKVCKNGLMVLKEGE